MLSKLHNHKYSSVASYVTSCVNSSAAAAYTREKRKRKSAARAGSPAKKSAPIAASRRTQEQDKVSFAIHYDQHKYNMHEYYN